MPQSRMAILRSQAEIPGYRTSNKIVRLHSRIASGGLAMFTCSVVYQLSFEPHYARQAALPISTEPIKATLQSIRSLSSARSNRSAARNHLLPSDNVVRGVRCRQVGPAQRNFTLPAFFIEKRD